MFNFFIYILLVIFLGYIGILTTRKNMIFFLVYLEIIFNGILLIFMITKGATISSDSVTYFLVILVLIASEAVVGLVLTILYSRSGKNINLNNLSVLNG